MNETNPYCAALGIEIPSLEAAKHSPDANFYSLLIVALLERGGPITLEEAAARFAAAGVAPAEQALASLRRCKPARSPIHRDGELYALDPHDDETDLWAFRLGLRPPKHTMLRVVRPDPRPLPSPDIALSAADLDEAWRDGIPWSWSAQRIAICVLDAHRGVMAPAEVLAFVQARNQGGRLSSDSAKYWRRGAAIRVQDDNRWALDPDHGAVSSARRAIRERIVTLRRWSDLRPDPAVIRASQLRAEREREARAVQLAGMRRAIVHAFPAGNPEAVVLLDVGRRDLATYVEGEVAAAVQKLLDYDIIAAVNVRGLLRSLGFEPGERLLAELGSPQKTKRLNRQGRTLKITFDLLVRGSCGISQPFGAAEVLKGYFRSREITKLRRRLEADAKSLFALYQYGRLHGSVRLRWGFLDERIPAPWVHRCEPTLCEIMQRAHDLGVPLEVVAGSAPGWADPWARVRQAYVMKEEGSWRSWLVDEHGFVIDERDVQGARLADQEGED